MRTIPKQFGAALVEETYVETAQPAPEEFKHIWQLRRVGVRENTPYYTSPLIIWSTRRWLRIVN